MTAACRVIYEKDSPDSGTYRNNSRLDISPYEKIINLRWQSIA